VRLGRQDKDGRINRCMIVHAFIDRWMGIWMDGLMDGSHSWVPKQGSGLIGGQKVCSDKR